MWFRKPAKKAELTAEAIKNTISGDLTSFNRDDLIKILNSIPVGVMLLNKMGKFIVINKKLSEITGYHYSEIPDIETWFSKAYPDLTYRNKIYDKWKQTNDFINSDTDKDIAITCRNGSLKHVVFSSALLKDGSSFITMVDITRLKEAEAKLLKSEEQFKIMFEAAKDPIYVLSRDGRFLQWNKATIDLTGRENLEEEFFYNFIMPECKDEIVKFYFNQYKKKIQLTYKEFPVLIQGRKVWIGQNAVPYIKDKKGYAESFLIISRNINEQIRLQQELERKNMELEELSSSDALTGLYNRRYFNMFFPQTIKNSSRFKKSLAVIFIDLNDFKKANDTYGHAFGDEVLILFSSILKNAGIRETDITCRYGGDEFIVVLGGMDSSDSKNNVTKIVNDIIQKWNSKKLKSDLLNNKTELNLSLSIGIRLVNYRDIDHFIKNSQETENIAEEILKQADASMYLAKEAYKRSSDKKESKIQFFSGSF